MTTEAEQRMFSAHKATTTKLKQQLAACREGRMTCHGCKSNTRSNVVDGQCAACWRCEALTQGLAWRRKQAELDAALNQLAACRAARDELERDVSRKVTEVQNELAKVEADRDRLREACKLGLRHFKPDDQQREIMARHPGMLEVSDTVCRAFEAALEPKP
jgi:hypothetical protein